MMCEKLITRKLQASLQLHLKTGKETIQNNYKHVEKNSLAMPLIPYYPRTGKRLSHHRFRREARRRQHRRHQ